MCDRARDGRTQNGEEGREKKGILTKTPALQANG